MPLPAVAVAAGRAVASVGTRVGAGAARGATAIGGRVLGGAGRAVGRGATGAARGAAQGATRGAARGAAGTARGAAQGAGRAAGRAAHTRPPTRPSHAGRPPTRTPRNAPGNGRRHPGGATPGGGRGGRGGLPGGPRSQLRDALGRGNDANDLRKRRQQRQRRKRGGRGPLPRAADKLSNEARRQLDIGRGDQDGAGEAAEESARRLLRRVKRLAQLDRDQFIRRRIRRSLTAVVLLFLLLVFPLLMIWLDAASQKVEEDMALYEEDELLAAMGQGLGPGPIPEALMGTVAAATGIPIDALRAYSSAAGSPDWPIDWRIMAGIGKAECDHGRSRVPYCSTPHNVWLTTMPNGSGERGPMQHLGHLWRRGKTDPDDPRVEGPPTPVNKDSTYVATDGSGDGVADPWNWYDATHSAARKLTLYREELRAKGAAYDTDEFMIAAYNAGVGGATRNGSNIADIPNKSYVDIVTAERSRIEAATAALGLNGAGYGLCPVAGRTEYSDSWGAGRSGGRRHEGVDMFAAKGTPVIAVKPGRVEHGQNNLGGNVYRLWADDGMYYYGAHLSAYGKSGRVQAGDVIGYVGNTGEWLNGGSMPNHLHWEVHPNGRGGPVNPTPYADQLCGKGGINTRNPQPSGGGAVAGGYSLPVARSYYSSNKSWFTKPHHDYPAADIPVGTGTDVYAMVGGKVTTVNDGSCGRGVVLEGDDGARYSYCHASSVLVSSGQRVVAGQHIMESGNTGNSTGPHLHLGIRIGGVSRCPQNLFVAIAEGGRPNVQGLPTSGCSY